MRASSGAVLLWIGLVGVVAPESAQGQVFDNGAPNGANAYIVQNPIAADFLLDTPTEIAAFRLWGWTVRETGAFLATSVFWSILANEGDAPGTTLASGHAPLAHSLSTSEVGSSFDRYQYDFSVPSLSLGTGIYWLALHRSATGEALAWEWADANSTLPLYASVSPPPDYAWEGRANEVAFQVFAAAPITTTPEPVSLALLCSGLFGLVIARRPWRRRNQSMS